MSSGRSRSGGMWIGRTLRRNSRSSRNWPCREAFARSLFVAAITRTSTVTGFSPPSRSITPDSSTRSNFAWASGLRSPTSSRNKVGDLSPEAQAKLLRVLESGVIERLGGEKPVTVDVRVIAATNKDLAKASQQGQFRDDLLFRLNVLPIHIPPLRERPDDIPPLVQHFAARQATRLGRSVEFDAGAVQLLGTYAWPGNVRELANIMERLVILYGGDVVTADDVARVMPGDGVSPSTTPGEGWSDVALAEALDGFERTLIARALSAARGNVAEAARKLATDRANLYRRMRRLGLEPPRNVAG